MFMSIRVMARVWDEVGLQDQTELLVMLALADRSDEEGKCWPSIATIAKKCRIEERSVYRVIDRLLSAGFLKKESGTGKTTNHYTITLTNGHPCLKVTPDPSVRSPLTQSQATPDPGSDNSSLYISKSSVRGPQSFVTRQKVEDWCKRKGYSRLTDTAWGKLMSGKFFGVPIINEQDFTAAMADILDNWLDKP